MELRKAGRAIEQRKPIGIRYDEQVVGDYVVDLRVEGAFLVELKAVKTLDELHMAQCLNYLKATRLSFGQARIRIERIVNHL